MRRPGEAARARTPVAQHPMWKDDRNDRRSRPQAVRLRQRPAHPRLSAAGRGDQRAGDRSSSAVRRGAARPHRRIQEAARRRRQTLDDILVPAFATVREAAKRTLGQRHFDVQLIGGMVLHEGKIAEMKTGEGKTLVATLPVYLNALAGRASMSSPSTTTSPSATPSGWARSTASSASPSASSCTASTTSERKQAYACDVTYGTNNEFGFDYLRDNMKYRLEEMVQRGHIFAIVDEVDSILIDEARTPLIISGPLDDRSELYNTIDAYHPAGSTRADYELDEKQRTVDPDRSRQGEAGAHAARRRPAQGRLALRHRERLGRPSRQSGAARAQAVPARQGLHRQATTRSSSSTSSPAA